jgi:hypothetical protein
MNSLTKMFSEFKDLSEEEGEIILSNEMDPKLMRPGVSLTPLQLQKFLEYYIQKETDPNDFKYTKTQLNKINAILHQHYHQINKDIKLFKLYKSFIQIVTQDMNLWIERDYYCADVILQILKDLEDHQDNPKYNKIYTKLRVNEMLNRHAQKTQHLRLVAENDRKFSKRVKNLEKKQKKLKKVDPFDTIQLPVKRNVVDNEENFEIFNRQNFWDSLEQDSSIFEPPKPILDQENKTEATIPLETPYKIPDFKQELKTETASLAISTPSSNENIFNPDPKPYKQEFDTFDIQEWYKPGGFNEDLLNMPEPHKRISYKNIDPRIEIYLKCKGLDDLLETNNFSNQLEKIFIVIHIKCLCAVVPIEKTVGLKAQVPIDAKQEAISGEKYLISYRPGTEEFLMSIKRYSEVYVYSDYSEDVSEALFPGVEIIYNKKINFSDEVLLILDNDCTEWDARFIVPLSYYSPFEPLIPILYTPLLPRLKIPEHIDWVIEFNDLHLRFLSDTLQNIYSSFLEHKLQNCIVWEYKEYLKGVLEGINIDITFYQNNIGRKGYSQEKLKVYCEIAKSLGAQVQENGKKILTEQKTHENEISTKWLLESYWKTTTIQIY